MHTAFIDIAQDLAGAQHTHRMPRIAPHVLHVAPLALGKDLPKQLRQSEFSAILL